MNIKNLLVLVSAVALASSAAAQSHQTLPELAKAEKARRAQLQKSGAPAKVYTEGDRSGAAAPEGDTTTAATGTAAPATAGGKKKEKTPEELAAEKQKEWDDKVKTAQDNIKNVQEAITRNERVLASMYNITPARQDVINNIEADKKKLADLQQTLVALEDERRRAGMPRK